MMASVECPGLPASWLNAWLAAIGLLVLEPRLRLSWTSDPSPIAVLSTDGAADPIACTVGAWPGIDRLYAMPIAEHVEGLAEMQRTVPVEVFCERAGIARGHVDSWTLSSTVTDLCVDASTDAKRTVRHARLDPKGPGTIKWLHHRLIRSYSMVDDSSEQVVSTLQGHGRRVRANGLGFDATRISALADSGHPMVDPVIEVLAFFGLQLLPMRGAGIEVGRSGTRSRFAARQRCWSLDRSRTPPVQHMTWPAWEQDLDRSGVDALLDLWSDLNERLAGVGRVSRAERSRLGIHAAWRSVPYTGRGSGDRTVGFASARLELDARRR